MNNMIDEDEEECRVCRGEAEPEHPLFQPCKCSGSIAFAHQDCLKSWLEVRRADGRCELCKTKFQFAPQYAEGTPTHLPTREVFSILLQQAAIRWIPFLIRCLFAASLWLVFAPLCTCYLYYGWAHRPTSLFERMTLALVPKDIVAGAVVAAFVIISFLALMSFADFLRTEWQQGGFRRRRNRFQDAPPRPRPQPGQIDMTLWNHVLERQRLDDEDSEDDSDYQEESDSDDFSDMDLDSDSDEDENGDAEDGQIQPMDVDVPRNDDFNGVDDQVELDINVALDELLGVRGPLLGVIRNFAWLLAFNTVYLGFFLFTPRVLGSAFLTMTNITKSLHASNTTDQEVYNSTNPVMSLISSIDTVSEHAQSTFRLPDLLIVLIGYFLCATSFMCLRLCWILSKKIQAFYRRRRGTGNNEINHGDGQRERRELQNLLRNIMQNEGEFDPNLIDANVEEDVAIGVAIDVAFEATMAVVKVGTLLFVKMLCLPITLGMWLRFMVIDIVGGTVEGMVSQAGSDFFSFAFLHWVIGITFMLIVTVAVLQFREVMHPDLLSQVIRPQEPQPDLLGNLMGETIFTHTKRMSVSLLIYAGLLFIHTYIPIKVAALIGADRLFPVLHFKTSYYFMQELQIPLELLTFHLCMLALLEKNKNLIGQMQHSWVKKMSNFMNLSDQLLPKEVQGFRLVGMKDCLVSSGELDPLWALLVQANTEEKKESIIKDSLSSFTPTEQELSKQCMTNTYGEKLLSLNKQFIKIPYTGQSKTHSYLPQKIGCFRLSVQLEGDRRAYSVCLYEEVVGRPVSRPPDGWDDLGGGGADVQGRWAWRKEKKSQIEEGIARRRALFPKGMSSFQAAIVWTKLTIMGFSAWFSTTFLVFASFFGPLLTGRLIYFVLQVPDSMIHDFFSLLMGSLIFYPLAFRLVTWFNSTSLIKEFGAWARRVRGPPIRKLGVVTLAALLWFVASPILLGSLYDVAFLKSADWLQNPTTLPLASVYRNCLVGNAFLSLWSYFCVAEVFSKRFWVSLFGRQERPAENQEPESRGSWQGRNGRLGVFWSCWKRLLIDWEWDMARSDALVNECALPVLRGLLLTALPAVISVLIGKIPSNNWSHLFTNVYTVRGLLFAGLAVQITKLWYRELSSWFEAARKRARDERYLIGEILLNYEEH